MASKEEFKELARSMLTEEQQAVFEECINGTNSVFCTGEGGTGKSWIIETVINYFRNFPLPDNKLVAVTASTGIAAYLVKGITLHRFAGIGIEETDVVEMIRRASRGPSKQYWKDTSILIIDEVSMISATLFENLSLVAQEFRSSTLPFGGMRLLMFGDFLQLPPISKIDHPSMRIFHSDAWKDLPLKIFELRMIVRQSDPEFRRVLSEIRRGICTDESEEYLLRLDRPIEYDDGIEPVRLFSRRDTTEIYNVAKLGLLSTPVKVYSSLDIGDIQSLKQCPAPSLLQLKEGCQVILIRNLTSTAVNGSVGTVVGFEYMREARSYQPRVKFSTMSGDGTTIVVGKSVWESIAPDGRVVSSRTQVPLMLAWAITIHKSQGQTIPRLCVDMQGIFEVGQAYVAISRCPNPKNLQIVNFGKHLIMAAPSCVSFYNDIQISNPTTEELPEYDRAPSYEDATEDNNATQVAETTGTEWDNNSAHPLLERTTDDTQLMLGQLSLRERSTRSHSDSEN